jgi:hypothetical protein
MYRVKDYLYLYTKSLKKNLRTFPFLLRVDKIFFFKKKSNMPLPIELSIPEKKSLFFLVYNRFFIYINIQILFIIPYMIKDQKEEELAVQV